MPATGYLAGGQVVPRRAVKLNNAGKVVQAGPTDTTGATVGNSPILGIAQASGRGAPGTPWATGWTGTPTATTPAAYPIAADLNQELHVWDTDGQECEAEVGTPTAADLDPGAGVATLGGAIVQGDKLAAGTDGILMKLQGAGYYVAQALADVAANDPLNGTDKIAIIMVRIDRGYRAA